MGKKSKSHDRGVSHERLAEADYYARKCGLPRDEALSIIECAYRLPTAGKARKIKPGKGKR
ncbi:hypothetical protein EN828_05435 [Mesorhizobium sp. M2D.F.Ca.ET.185.01.1.1]|uniref:hypothetical protein n=1 Tax=unclassified Mesorhizobium TaxID=325217 RepID=UPI000FCAD547|nr:MULTISPECIES: hypothetical protein [unclassified Mesorhizobium]TGP77417.1 hypothetical protein EN870_19470 [bacterium M00.F.Ca.ET.227.01.1.1]TGP93212.1 hypothetical protein EN865_19665 [bacterium M00.F.Ca.ET.222.01.1.1]TGP96758.1 hypothetical protein EN864_09950 [bacterium M00.F.Ca.ET.221.01.1.1]TGT96091.1 hypothetical protein EN806_52995 [bacterium M00.F.Ca.ET.163.01.1.1]TGU21175.1 hypothetical protein EN799_54625 [bacterium M00.F.Ca.ET.156.01.1.1]TGU49970.1 hypothetical protein EN789_053